jgi:hypothetical protein
MNSDNGNYGDKSTCLSFAQSTGSVFKNTSSINTNSKTTDLILLALRAEFRNYTHAGYAHFCLKLDIEEVIASGSTIQEERCPNRKLFAFTSGWNEPDVLPVKLVPTENEDCFISLKFNGIWQPFHKFLDSLIPQDPPIDVTNLWNMWQSNGKRFPFFRLPRELRDLMYAEILVGGKNRRIFPQGYSIHYGVRSHMGITRTDSRHNLNILAKRRPTIQRYNGTYNPPCARGHNTPTDGKGGSLQLYEEAVKVLYSSGKFEFTLSDQFRRIFWSIRQDHFKLIREIEFDFKHINFLKALGMNFNQYHSYHVCPAMEAIKTLPLRKLIIRIPSPIWMSGYNSLPIKLWDEYRVGYGCQTKTIQWILDLLLPLVAHLESHNIEIHGYIKHSQKERFFRRLVRYKEQMAEPTISSEEIHDVEQGGVPLDCLEVQRILSFPSPFLEPTEKQLYIPQCYDPEEISPDTQLQVPILYYIEESS